MTPAQHAVSSRLTVDLIGPDGSAPVEAVFRYTLSDPYAVELAFPMSGGEVVWVFGRDLLRQGLHAPVGEGDVQMFPCLDPQGHAVVVLQLISPSGEAVVEVHTRDVLEFLGQTVQIVWPGAEDAHTSVDATIAAILVDD